MRFHLILLSFGSVVVMLFRLITVLKRKENGEIGCPVRQGGDPARHKPFSWCDARNRACDVRHMGVCRPSEGHPVRHTLLWCAPPFASCPVLLFFVWFNFMPITCIPPIPYLHHLFIYFLFCCDFK